MIAVEVFLTAYQAITWNGYLKDGETILIHAVSTGRQYVHRKSNARPLLNIERKRKRIKMKDVKLTSAPEGLAGDIYWDNLAT